MSHLTTLVETFLGLVKDMALDDRGLDEHLLRYRVGNILEYTIGYRHEITQDEANAQLKRIYGKGY